MPGRRNNKVTVTFDTITWDINDVNRGFTLHSVHLGYFDLTSKNWISEQDWELLSNAQRSKILQDHDIYATAYKIWGREMGHERGIRAIRRYYAEQKKENA